MNNSYKRMFFAWLVAGMGVCKVASSQALSASLITSETPGGMHFNRQDDVSRIRWSWQLPDCIKKAFNQSSFCDWYIEKMIRYEAEGKTLYTFYLNNSCLLDSDHYDCFFKKSKLMVAGDGTVIDTAATE